MVKFLEDELKGRMAIEPNPIRDRKVCWYIRTQRNSNNNNILNPI